MLQFEAGNLNFHSSTYEWLVVSGAQAQYRGVRTINGAGNYFFLLTAIDGQLNGGGGTDKFRIKIGKSLVMAATPPSMTTRWAKMLPVTMQLH